MVGCRNSMPRKGTASLILTQSNARGTRNATRSHTKGGRVLTRVTPFAGWVGLSTII